MRESSNRPADDLIHYPVEVLNRAADIFRMAGHMLGKRLLLRLGLVVSLVNDDPNREGGRSIPLLRRRPRTGLQKFAVIEAGLGHRSHFFHVGRR